MLKISYLISLISGVRKASAQMSKKKYLMSQRKVGQNAKYMKENHVKPICNQVMN